MARARLVFAVFVIFQIADGLFTYVAVQSFGIAAEGNPLLVSWMHLAGPGQTLLGAKLLACCCGAVLYVLGVCRILAVLTLFYLAAAIIPWLHVFLLGA
ncbi:MAG: hypothetical protein H0X67_12230 [Acidobacteria bacterium]|nr:hypothetical protein [Acidobacteriota bacterium]